MKRVQIIEHNGKPAFAVVPIDLWERVRENLDDADAMTAYDRAVGQDDGFTILGVARAAGRAAALIPNSVQMHRRAWLLSAQQRRARAGASAPL